MSDGEWETVVAPRRGKRANGGNAGGKIAAAAKFSSLSSALNTVRADSEAFESLPAATQLARASALSTQLLTHAYSLASTAFAADSIAHLLASHTTLSAPVLARTLAADAAAWRAAVTARMAAVDAELGSSPSVDGSGCGTPTSPFKARAAKAAQLTRALPTPAALTAATSSTPSDAASEPSVSLGCWRRDLRAILAHSSPHLLREYAPASPTCRGMASGTEALAALSLEPSPVQEPAPALSLASGCAPAQMRALSCVGIGRIASARAAQKQLALFLLWTAVFAGDQVSDCGQGSGPGAASEVTVYDPILTALEARALTLLGLVVPSTNAEARVPALPSAPPTTQAQDPAVGVTAAAIAAAGGPPTLVYLPHCGLGLTTNTLWTNAPGGASSLSGGLSTPSSQDGDLGGLGRLILVCNDIPHVLSPSRYPPLAPTAQKKVWSTVDAAAAGCCGRDKGKGKGKMAMGEDGSMDEESATAAAVHAMSVAVAEAGSALVPAPALRGLAGLLLRDPPTPSSHISGTAASANVETVAAFRASLTHQHATAAANAATGDSNEPPSARATTTFPWVTAARLCAFARIAPLPKSVFSDLNDSFSNTSIHTFQLVPPAVARAPLPDYRVDVVPAGVPDGATVGAAGARSKVRGAANGEKRFSEEGGEQGMAVGNTRSTDPEIIPASIFK